MKHTQGPWAVSNKCNQYQLAIHSDKMTIAHTTFDIERTGINEANAKLIAAAPNLLEALTELLESYKLYVKKPNESEFVIKAELAIKKATE